MKALSNLQLFAVLLYALREIGEAGDQEGVKVLWVQSLKYETWRRVGIVRDETGKKGATQT